MVRVSKLSFTNAATILQNEGDFIHLTTQEFNRISTYMKQHFGINLTEKKRTLVETRLQSMVKSRQFETYNAYFDIIMADHSGKEVTELLNFLTTNHTYFMREVEHFDYLKTHMLPDIFHNYHHEKDLRIWSAGCSSGQEPYTISMIVSDFIARSAPKYNGWNHQMLATDISEKALTKAISGCYDQKDVDDLPNHWLQQYFTKDHTNYTAKSTLKSDIIFRKFNLMTPTFPFKKQFHIIFCRNVMIYFDTPTKDAIIQKYYDHLVPGGYLLIGHSEFINRNTSEFEYIQPAVYKKPGGVQYV